MVPVGNGPRCPAGASGAAARNAGPWRGGGRLHLLALCLSRSGQQRLHAEARHKLLAAQCFPEMPGGSGAPARHTLFTA
jgi:hypothetical protein